MFPPRMDRYSSGEIQRINVRAVLYTLLFIVILHGCRKPLAYVLSCAHFVCFWRMAMLLDKKIGMRETGYDAGENFPPMRWLVKGFLRDFWGFILIPLATLLANWFYGKVQDGDVASVLCLGVPFLFAPYEHIALGTAWSNHGTFRRGTFGYALTLFIELVVCYTLCVVIPIRNWF